MKLKSISISVLLLSIILHWSCNRNRNMPGYEFMPDMVYSQAYEAFSENPNFEDGMTLRVPVEGTVPMGHTPFSYTVNEESRVKAGIELINPVSVDNETLARGKEIYSIFCIQCHGLRGEGDGNLYASGLYPIKPRALTSDIAVRLMDGEIYHSITLGFGSMGAHDSQIRPDERWKLVLYIRELQRNAKADSDLK